MQPFEQERGSLPRQMRSRPSVRSFADRRTTSGVANELGNCRSELLVGLGDEEMLARHGGNTLEGPGRSDNRLSRRERLDHLDSHPSAEPQRCDDNGGVLEVWRDVGNVAVDGGPRRVKRSHLRRGRMAHDVEHEVGKGVAQPWEDVSREPNGASTFGVCTNEPTHRTVGGAPPVGLSGRAEMSVPRGETLTREPAENLRTAAASLSVKTTTRSTCSNMRDSNLFHASSSARERSLGVRALRDCSSLAAATAKSCSTSTEGGRTSGRAATY